MILTEDGGDWTHYFDINFSNMTFYGEDASSDPTDCNGTYTITFVRVGD